MKCWVNSNEYLLSCVSEMKIFSFNSDAVQFVTPTYFTQELRTTIKLCFISGRTRNLPRLIVRSLESCLCFHSVASIFLREYLSFRRSPTSSIASRACWMITTSKSIRCAADAIDSRELVGCVRETRQLPPCVTSACACIQSQQGGTEPNSNTTVVKFPVSKPDWPRKHEKAGKFRVTAASTSVWHLIGQQHDHAVSWLVVARVNVPKALQRCNPESIKASTYKRDSSHLIKHFPGVWSWKTNPCSCLDQWSGREPSDDYSYVSF